MSIMTYEEYKEQCYKPSYSSDTECFRCGKPNAIYEGGDARFYCPMCEECVGIPRWYKVYVERRRKTEELYRLHKIKFYDKEVDKYGF